MTNSTFSLKKSFLAISVSMAFSHIAAADHDHQAMEEVLVEGSRSANSVSLDVPAQPVTDATDLLKQAPGANINYNGPLTGIAQMRGLFGQRIAVGINGSYISSGGPNWMDPPLHYAPAAIIEDITVFRGIAPVSAGQQTLGGAMQVEIWKGSFAEDERVDVNGRAVLGYESVSDGIEAAVMAAIANQHHKLGVSVVEQQGDDAKYDKGTISPSEYDRQRGEISYGYQREQHSLRVSLMRNETGETGTPALPMDIIYVDTDATQLAYGFKQKTWGIDIKLNEAEVEHVMNNYSLRQPGMMLRSTLATGDSSDVAVKFWFEQGDVTYKAGFDIHSSEHSADISDPSNAMFFVQNFNEAQQDILGVFAEVDAPLSEQSMLSAGIRLNQVDYDAGTVNGAPAMMMPAAGMLRDAFNNADRSGSDSNMDLVLGYQYKMNEHYTWVASIGQKTRSASYQERYLWLPMQATAGLADGNTYVGNLDLDAETSSEIDFGFDYQSADLFVSPRVFYKKVDDYIQGTPSTSPQVIMVSTMMMGDPTPLQFNNLEASLYGADMELLWQLSSHWRFESVVSYVRGVRDDVDDDLYRIAPLNGSFAFTYAAENNWSATLQAEAAAEQNKVSELNNEQASEAYVVWNLHLQTSPAENITVSGGIGNLLDKDYEPHLNGVNRVMGSDVAQGDRIPGEGRNLYLQARYEF